MKNHATALFFLALLSVLLGSATSAKAETIYRLLAYTDGFRMENPPPNDKTEFYASAGSRFKIVNDTGSDLVVLFTGGIDSHSSPAQASTSSEHVVKEVNYLISKEIITEYRYELAFGFTCGFLTTAPVKIQLCDGNMTTGANLGAYAGWKVSLAHIPFTILGSAGSALIPISDFGTDEVETKLGWTFAIGLLIEPISNYQIGILSGIDHLVGDARDDYPYQNEIWISIGIGFDFIN